MLLRLLIFGDVHSRTGMLEALAEKAKGLKIDASLCTGDLTNEATFKIAERIVLVMEESFGKNFFVPGNQESKEILALFESKKMSLHRRVEEFNGFSFIGIGGAKPAYCFYRFNLGELEASKFLSENWPSGERPAILLAHNPAFGTKLAMASSGMDLGLNAFRKMIEQKQPLLFVHGHVHEAFGSEKIGRTTCVNPGSLAEGRATIVEIEKSGVKKVEFLKVD